jgi:NAD(P)H-hydrate repair Nnr-like enzyme with NAD(P)H-hydrate epimerase domain
LILAGVGAGGDGLRLAMRLRLEGRRAHVRHPNLDRAQALTTQALAVRPHVVTVSLELAVMIGLHIYYM